MFNFSEVEKPDEGWKSKLKRPPPDRRIQTSVSIKQIIINTIMKKFKLIMWTSCGIMISM